MKKRKDWYVNRKIDQEYADRLAEKYGSARTENALTLATEWDIKIRTYLKMHSVPQTIKFFGIERQTAVCLAEAV